MRVVAALNARARRNLATDSSQTEESGPPALARPWPKSWTWTEVEGTGSGGGYVQDVRREGKLDDGEECPHDRRRGSPQQSTSKEST